MSKILEIIKLANELGYENHMHIQHLTHNEFNQKIETAIIADWLEKEYHHKVYPVHSEATGKWKFDQYEYNSTNGGWRRILAHFESYTLKQEAIEQGILAVLRLLVLNDEGVKESAIAPRGAGLSEFLRSKMETSEWD